MIGWYLCIYSGLSVVAPPAPPDIYSVCYGAASLSHCSLLSLPSSSLGSSHYNQTRRWGIGRLLWDISYPYESTIIEQHFVLFFLRLQNLNDKESSPKQSSLQVVRIIAPDHAAALINQSALVDKHNSVVTFSVTSHPNHTSTVLFDIKHVRSLILYWL